MWHFDGHHFWGMHWIWWILWVIFLIWVFATPWDVPGQRIKKETPLDILERRYASGEIDSAEFEERKKALLKK
ncbi:MAG: SHOCT domain-containing protein [Cyclobacteriaceae bacterium]